MIILNHTRQTKYSSLNYYIANSKYNIKYLSCYLKKKSIKTKNSNMNKNYNFIKFSNCDLIIKKNNKKILYSNKHTRSNSLLKLNSVTSRINKILNYYNYQKERSNSCDEKPKKKLIILKSKTLNKIKNKINNNSYCTNTKKKNHKVKKIYY